MTSTAIRALVFLVFCLVFALCMYLSSRSKRPWLTLMFSVLTAVTAIAAVVFAFRI